MADHRDEDDWFPSDCVGPGTEEGGRQDAGEGGQHGGVEAEGGDLLLHQALLLRVLADAVADLVCQVKIYSAGFLYQKVCEDDAVNSSYEKRYLQQNVETKPVDTKGEGVDSDGKFNVEAVVEADAGWGALHGSGGLRDWSILRREYRLWASCSASAPHGRHQTPPGPASHTRYQWWT